jgi:hypothetical protein
MKSPIFLMSAITMLALAGCAQDPVADLMKRNGGFVAVRPPSDGEYLGDVYRSKNLIEQSISMKNVMSPAELEKMMRGHAKSVSLESSSGNSSFKISANVAYLGIASAALEASGATKYSVNISQPVIYDSPLDSDLAPVLIPSIESRFPNVPLQGKYIVRSLLQVGGLEYEFHREGGAKIDLSADQNLVKNLTAKLGTEWKVTRDGKLAITQPRYIGYRLARIDDAGKVIPASESLQAVEAGGTAGRNRGVSREAKLSQLALAEYDNRDLRQRQHMKQRSFSH